MASFKTIPVSSIFVGERARPVDEEVATAIAASMADRGLINPLTVRSTPAANGGTTPWTLIAGGHRLFGAKLNKWEEIDVIVVSADAEEAQLIEISENLYRNDLTALDRGIFVAKFRELYEEKFGKIGRGGDRKSNRNDCGLIFTPGREISDRIKDRFGFGQRTYEYASRIGLKLHPALRNAVRGTDAENDQKLLLKLAGLPEAKQAGIAAGLKIEPDVRKVLGADKPAAPPIDLQAALLKKLTAAWDEADEQTRYEFLVHAGIDPLDISGTALGDMMDEARREAVAA
ncbi:ParB N-terminal domain-containing protein [Shinella sp. CPCC 100929]|uniref:ParB N-terminal domain-containing protein n=1 Tax=Shinella lacus TaxID=2654216 RepID=A0ABT1R769_9HYPH|nr:ParB N-terminal domain-containing protein [Shinella lacus]MCQ4630904.1 ParB N-terminal domain-containing protein [Shinella lacus]